MSDKKLILCPYCGNTQTEPEDRCASCGGFFDPLSLKVTQQHMGPWFVRDRNNPFRPGCSYEVLVKQIEKGKLKATTIIRGPTTKQYWSVARHVPGVSHLLGYCHNCGAHVEPNAESCSQCGEVFFAPRLRDNLGLAAAGADVHIQPKLSDSGAFEALGDESHAIHPPIKLPSASATGSSGTPGSFSAGKFAASAGFGASADDISAQPEPSAPPASIASTIASFSAGHNRQFTDPPVGSSILAGLRPQPPADDRPVHAATAQATASRDAMAWMTGSDQSELDSLATAVQGYTPPQRSGINWATWVLIAINLALLAAGAAVVFIAIQRNQPSAPAPGTPGSSDSSGNTPAVAPANPDDMAAHLPQRRERPVDSTTTNPPPPATPTANLPDAPAPIDSPNAGNTTAPLPTSRVPTPAPGTPGSSGSATRPSNIFSDEAPEKLSPADRQRRNWQARFAEARDAERRGDMDAALKMYQQLKPQAPTDLQPDVDQAIARVRDAKQRQPLEKFIGK